jgi:hypothetical protein
MSRTANCKLQIADCKLQIEQRLNRLALQIGAQIGWMGRLSTGYRSICNLKSAITNLHWAILVLLLPSVLHAGDPAKADRPTREIFVPFGDLNVLLEQQPKRVLLSRHEYDELLKKAKESPTEHAPEKAIIVSADYDAKITGQRAEIAGTLGIDVLEDGLHALALSINGVGLRIATLDGHGASLGQAERETLVSDSLAGEANQAAVAPARSDIAILQTGHGALALFVEGKGRHELKLEMVAPVVSTAAKQALKYRLPRPPAATMRLTVPGDVEIKSGASVISRTVEGGDTDKHTRFALLPQEGDVALEMSLNSHLQRQSRAVAVRSVLIDEITEGYEKLHATVSLEILYQPMDQFRFAVPEGFEITEISSPLLARWDVQEVGGKRFMNVRLRERTNETVVLNVSALRTPSRLAAWQSPDLRPLPLDEGPLDVVAQSAIVGLMVEDRLKPETIDAEGLIAIDTSVLAKALPASLAHAAPGTPPLRAEAAYYAPERAFKLAAKFVKPSAEMAVNTGLLWRVFDRGYEVLGGITLLPRGEKLFSFDFSTPPGWSVTSVTAAGEKPLKFDKFGAANEAGRVRVYVPEGMPAEREFKVNFQAMQTPAGWLDDWKARENVFKADFPIFTVAGAARYEGAIAVETHDDLTVRPATLQSLVPLDDSEKAVYGLEGVALNLAYRCEDPQYAAVAVFERTAPRLSARTFSFLQISPDGLTAHYEAIFNIDEARTQSLTLLLPESTPMALAIRGLDGVVVKEFSASELTKEKMRPWHVLLSEPKRGKVRLTVDFQQPLPTREPKNYVLPILAADGAIYQSGLVAVEGCAEFDMQVKTGDRKVDVGELVDADYQPGRRLLGAYGFAGVPPDVKVDVSRNPSYPIYPAIVQKAELTTHLSPDGESHTEACFALRTKALYLELQMPDRSELWSSEIDGAPMKPQREKKSILLGLPSVAGNIQHTITVVYRTPTDVLGFRGSVELAGPRLLLRSDRQGDAVEVPLADLQWRLCLPNGYEVVRSTGTVTTDELARPGLGAVSAAASLYELCGGVGKYGMLPAVTRAAREAASFSRIETAKSINREYDSLRYTSEAKTAAPARVRAPLAAAEEKSEEAPSPMANAPAAAPATPPLEPPPRDEVKKKSDVAGGTPTTRHGDLAELRKMAGSLGTADSETLTEGQKKALEERIESIRAKFEEKKAGAELAKPGSVDQSRPDAADKDIAGVAAKAPERRPQGEGYLEVVSGKLTGVRSLKIELGDTPEFDGRVMNFKSLGKDAVLKVELADRERFAMLGWAVALAAFLIGVAMTRRTARAKLRYVVLVAIVATLVPAVWDCVATAWVCNMLFYSACWLVLY